MSSTRLSSVNHSRSLLQALVQNLATSPSQTLHPNVSASYKKYHGVPTVCQAFRPSLTSIPSFHLPRWGGGCLQASSPLPGICLNPIPSHPASGSPDAVALVKHFDYVPTLPSNLAFDYQRQCNVCVLGFCT